jgi:hypothetical protein
MKLPDFGDILKIGLFFIEALRVSCVLQEFKFMPKFLGYLTDHRWGVPKVLTWKCIDYLKLNFFCCD